MIEDITRIDYNKIANAIDFYRCLGYRYLEVPWVVDLQSIKVTIPTNVSPHQVSLGERTAGFLVGSGEQSLLQIRDTLKPGRYQCATPCFRDEPHYNELRRPNFFKVELMLVADSPTDKDVMEVLEHAQQFFGQYGPALIRPTEEGLDLYMNGFEVGSYGIRHYQGFTWVYGTGCAEPRLSQAVVNI